MNEVWKDIPGYEGSYQASNLGNIKSLDRKNLIGRKIKGKVLKPSNDNYGYLQVILYKNGNKKTFKVHKLVSLAFIPNPETKEQINHIDCNKLNNKIWNLEWCTRSENMLHAYKNGLNHSLQAENHPMCNLTNEEVFQIYDLSTKSEYFQVDIAKFYNTNQNTVSKIKNKKLFKSILK